MVWIICLVVVLLLWLLYTNRKPPNSPPGPFNIPLVGQALSLDKVHIEVTFDRWRQQYGDIFAVKVGSSRMVVLSEAELIREAFSKLSAAGRPGGPAIELFDTQLGLVFSTGERWQQLRRFTLFHLRNFGMGKARLEGMIQDQVNGFLNEVMLPSQGQPLEIDHSLNIAILNIIWSLVAGETLNIKDEKVLRVMRQLKEANEYVGTFTLVLLMPALIKILPKSFLGVDKVEELFFAPVRELIEPAVAEHRARLDPQSEPRDYIDCYLLEQRKNGQIFTDVSLVRCVLDMFSAGSDTTSTTLRWAFCILCACPKTQRRVRAEVDEVVGRSRPPSLADRNSMPYTDAFIMETQRLADIVPAGVVHMAVEPFQLAGYTINKDEMLFPLLSAVHRNAKYFPEPETFRPERFLDSAGRLAPSKYVMPFSTGKRSCLGEAMARSELFIFITAALQKFNFRFPDGFHHDLSSNTSDAGLRQPKPYQIVPTCRD